MTTEVAPVDLERLNRRYQGLRVRAGALQGQARELQARRTRLTQSVSLAKARIDLAPQATEVFNYLQEKAHKRAVGDFEDLLTAFVSDVIPEAGSIRLELGTERGAPALDIMLDNGGDLENIYDGNGGGLTNVVVTGLAFSALSRTRNRQFMLLDEPDCWLPAANVPAFTKVIGEVANPRTAEDGTLLPGCQTLMVSHNDIGLMDEGAHIQRLRIEADLNEFAARKGVEIVHVGDVGPCAYVVWVDNGKAKPTIEVRYRENGAGDDENNALTKGYPIIDSVSGSRAWPDDTQVGIRWVEAINLRRHVHTRLSLSSGLNVLTGGANGGKSTLYFTALRAMSYGESDDSMIRHGADTATIRMGLENGVVLEMVRSRKGSPKVVFRRYEHGKKTHDGRQEQRGGVPDFISQSLNIERVDGMDIQLRSQKQPIFLLNETATRRAQLLSVGRESGLLQELMERQRQTLRRDKELVKREEVELNDVTRQLTILAPLAGMASLDEMIDGVFEAALECGAKVKAAKEMATSLAAMEPFAKAQCHFGEQLVNRPKVPALTATQELSALIEKLSSLQHVQHMPTFPVVPAAPTLWPTADFEELIGQLNAGLHAGQMLQLMPRCPAIPRIRDTSSLADLLSRLSSTMNADAVLNRLPVAPTLPSLRDTQPLREVGIALANHGKTLEAAKAELAEASIEQKTAEAAKQALQDELGLCPVCEKPFDDHDHV